MQQLRLPERMFECRSLEDHPIDNGDVVTLFPEKDKVVVKRNRQDRTAEFRLSEFGYGFIDHVLNEYKELFK